MKIRRTTTFVADNGSMFDNAEDCIKYNEMQKRLREIEELKQAYINVQKAILKEMQDILVALYGEE